ncbi:MAG: CopG family antitoxin [Armatimonadota bacterium]|nr:CopG family antitoxin [Armatimonadota bacterium]
MKKKLPKFKTEEEEVEFWETHDATDYFDDGERVDVDFAPAREARDQRPRGVILYRRRLRKAAG